MNRLLVASAVALVMLASCARTISVASGRSASIRLRVISASDNVTRIPGAEVFAVGEAGTLSRLGVTNTFGEIRIDRATLSIEDNAVAIVVCHPMFFCGALRTGYVAPRDEMTLALAIVVTD